jgi:UDP-3-O-[3-hydroxymyristoyl] glucosamine N-acyltransferase
MSTRLKELVDRFGGQLHGDGNIEVIGIAPLDDATASHVTFLSNQKFREQAAKTQAAAIIVTAADNAFLGGNFIGARIVTDNPYAYFAKVAQYFVSGQAAHHLPGIHPSAFVDSAAHVDPGAYIGPHVVVEADAVIAKQCVVDAGSYVGRGAKIGAGTHLFAHSTVHAFCEIGQHGIIHSGAVIGADGFGFANESGAWIKIPQTGRVIIGDDVEIGANTCIDRGALKDTIIEDSVKLDNQIQIAHNCHIGAHTAMAACVGIAGSATIGKYCMIGGAAMIAGHLTIADKVHVSAGTLVMRSILEPGQYTGFYPVAKHAEWEKSAAMVRNLGAMREKIRHLEKIIKSLTEKQE